LQTFNPDNIAHGFSPLPTDLARPDLMISVPASMKIWLADERGSMDQFLVGAGIAFAR
jgi:hypothetical protein